MSFHNELFKNLWIKVYLKSDVSPEFLAYDSDVPGSKSESFIKYQIRVTTGNGRPLATYGKSEFNPLKAFAVYGLLGIGLFIAAKGVKGVIFK